MYKTYMEKHKHSSHEQGRHHWYFYSTGKTRRRNLEIKRALAFTNLKCIAVIGSFWGYTLHHLFLREQKHIKVNWCVVAQR